MTELKRHQQSKKHQEIVASCIATKPIDEIMVVDTSTDDVKKAEIKLVAFIVEHNLPFQGMDHLSDVVSTTFTDSKIAQQFSSKHTKTRSIIKNVLAKKFRNAFDEILRNIKFSIIIDESTDISTKKQLAIVVRFFCNQESMYHVSMLKCTIQTLQKVNKIEFISL